MTYRFAALLIALSTVFAAASARAQSVCPDNFVAFADTAETLTCTCAPEATDRGSVWGMDVYTGDSSICRAARHAGAITKKGGTVSVVPEPGRSAYPGVTRYGVESINYGAFASSFRFAGAAGTTAPGAPSSAGAAPAVQASVCPDNFVAFADTTETVTCTCAPEATDRGSVWGMDIYTGDSGVCKAARHAGVIPKNGGTVSVIPVPGRNAYAGVTRNGVASNNYGPFASSFRFAAAGAATATTPPSTAPAPAASAQGLDCPDNFVAFADSTEPLACTCSADAISRGSVWGMDVYTGDSGLCKAARHAGVISPKGGAVSVVAEPGRKAYAGVTRNGITSNNYGPFASSFRFAGGASAAPQAAGGAAPAPAQVSVCPDNFVAFADMGESLTCTCAPEAMDRGSVWGMDIYTGDSGLCKAAKHAGVVGPKGGSVTVLPEPGRKAYAGVTRNGVSSNNYGPFASSYRFAAKEPPPVAPAPPPPAPVAAPVQQPIAATLRERGEVALYIQFRTNSADLDPHTLPVLEELLAALKADNGLSLGLIGHTDAVGARDFNKTLSYRRAEAVRFWLADHGISASRIAVDGRGFDDPVADNASEQGRALNRRVQAKKM